MPPFRTMRSDRSDSTRRCRVLSRVSTPISTVLTGRLSGPYSSEMLRKLVEIVEVEGTVKHAEREIS